MGEPAGWGSRLRSPAQRTPAAPTEPGAGVSGPLGMALAVPNAELHVLLHPAGNGAPAWHGCCQAPLAGWGHLVPSIPALWTCICPWDGSHSSLGPGSSP